MIANMIEQSILLINAPLEEIFQQCIKIVKGRFVKHMFRNNKCFIVADTAYYIHNSTLSHTIIGEITTSGEVELQLKTKEKIQPRSLKKC